MKGKEEGGVGPRVSVGCKGGAQEATQERPVEPGHNVRHQVRHDQATGND